MDRTKCFRCMFYKPFVRMHLYCYNCINRSLDGFEDNFKEMDIKMKKDDKNYAPI